MPVPSEKSEAVEEQLEELSQQNYGRGRVDSIITATCVRCGQPATEFKDELSKKEFTISGFCQSCQDIIFG